MVSLVSVLILAVAMVCGTISGLYLLGRPDASARRTIQARPRHLGKAARRAQAARQARKVQRALVSQGRHRGRAVAIRARKVSDWSGAEPTHRIAVGAGPRTR
jgi:hypothetical protein